MPCMTPEPTKEELVRDEINKNKRKYGWAKTTNELIGDIINVACEMGSLLEDVGLLSRLNPDSYNWYINHKKFDKSRNKAELDKKKDELLKLEKQAFYLREDINRLR